MLARHHGKPLLKRRGPSHNDTDCQRTRSVKCIEVTQISIKEWVLVVPLHLDCNTGEAIIGPQLEHIDLMASDLGNKLGIDVRLNVHVFLAPPSFSQRTIEACRYLAPVSTWSQDVGLELNGEPCKGSEQFTPMPGKRVAQYNVCVPGYSVTVSLGQLLFGDG